MPNTPAKTIRVGGTDPKSEVLFKVYSNFAGIGTDVADMIAECAHEPVYMKALLDRLKVECARTDLDSQLKALSAFATELGETQFVMRLRLEVWKVIRSTEKNRSESKMRAVGLEAKPPAEKPNDTDGSDRYAKVGGSPTPSRDASDYRGPDRRRVVGDRRSNMDRRGYPEGMGTDKRSGRDRRRRPSGRRKSDGNSLM